jgi:inner membrane transporter RhtA
VATQASPSRGAIALPMLATTAAMVSFQTGAAFAKQLFPAVGPEGAATLRLTLGAAMLLILMRPWRSWPKRAPVLSLIGLGLSMAAAIQFFYLALNRLPLGVAIPLQFLGPLAVAVSTSRRPADFVWAAMAAAGVWGLVGAAAPERPIDFAGVPLALGAAAGWASYILFGRRVGAAFGTSAASLSVSIAALAILPVGIVHAGTALFDPRLAPLALFIAALSTAMPFSLELYALARMPAWTFAVFTSLEPAFSVASGFILLHERLAPAQVGGVAIVIAAAAGAAWSSAVRPGTEAARLAEAPPS